MGKIRVATLGMEEEKALRQKQKVRREEKKKREHAEKVHIAGMKGGERVKTVDMSEEDTDRMVRLSQESEQGADDTQAKEKAEKKRVRIKHRSEKYKQAIMRIEKGKLYPISEALALLRTVSLTTFDPTVELHINVTEKGLRGTVSLPHGTGKTLRIAIADSDSVDDIVSRVDQGTIDFDVLIADPKAMPKLAKIAKYLGPRGLMPNPKNGTISPEPERVAEKMRGGDVTWKTESEFPLLHFSIGKLSFSDQKLDENFSALTSSIGGSKITAITIKTTMSPGIDVSFSAP